MDEFFTQTDEKSDLLSDISNFDITVYLKDDMPPSQAEKNSKKHRAGVKKIDMKAQRYILDEEDDVDVETVSECGEPSPILQAGDLDSLLEQFEASEIPDLTLPEDFLETTSPLLNKIPKIEKIHIHQKNLLEESRTECKPVVKIKQENTENLEMLIKQEGVKSEFENKPCLSPELDNQSQTIKREVIQQLKVKKEAQEKQRDIKENSEVGKSKYFFYNSTVFYSSRHRESNQIFTQSMYAIDIK